MIVHHTRSRENGDLHLWEAPALRQKPVFLNVRVPITREIMRSRDAQWDQFRFLGNCPPTLTKSNTVLNVFLSYF